MLSGIESHLHAGQTAQRLPVFAWEVPKGLITGHGEVCSSSACCIAEENRGLCGITLLGLVLWKFCLSILRCKVEVS